MMRIRRSFQQQKSWRKWNFPKKKEKNQQKKGSKDETTGDEIHVKTRGSQLAKYKGNCLPNWQTFYLCYHTMLYCCNRVTGKFPSIKDMGDLNKAPPAVRMHLGKLLFEDFEHVLRSIYLHYSQFRYLRELYLWKNFVSSQFLVHSFQKKGTIMIDIKDKEHSAYLVKGLYESFEELISRQQSAERAASKSAKKGEQFKVQLPIVIETVLLPFQEGISYNTTFTMVKKSDEELKDMKKEYEVYYQMHVKNSAIIRFQQLKGMEDIGKQCKRI